MQPPGTERNIQRTRQARTIFGFVLLFVALLGFAFWNIAAGSTPMSLPEVFDGLLDPSSPHRVIVMDVRMVRIVPAILLGGALALSLGIAIQNFPEGAIISMPLRAEGKSKLRAFAGGAISGAVEPVGAALTVLFAGLFVPVMPYMLAFAAGAMNYVVVEELIPEMSEGEHSNV